MITVRNCYSCNAPDAQIEFDSEYYCDNECIGAENNGDTCVKCDVFSSSVKEDGYGKPYCPDCFSDLNECTHCFSHYEENKITETKDGDILCKECTKELVDCFVCSDSVYQHEEMHSSRRKEYLCCACYDNDKATNCMHCRNLLITEEAYSYYLAKSSTKHYYCDDSCADSDGYSLCKNCEELQETKNVITFKDQDYCSYACADARKCASCGEAYAKENTSDYCSNICAAENGYLRCTTCSTQLTKDFVEYKVDTDLYVAYCNDTCMKNTTCYVCSKKHNDLESYKVDSHNFCSTRCTDIYKIAKQKKLQDDLHKKEKSFENIIKVKCHRCIEGTSDIAMYERTKKIMQRLSKISRANLYKIGFIETIDNLLFVCKLNETTKLVVGPIFAYIHEKHKDGTEKYFKVYDLFTGDTLKESHQNAYRLKLQRLEPFLTVMSLSKSIEKYCT